MSSMSAETKDDRSNDPNQQDDSSDHDQQDAKPDDVQITDNRHVLLHFDGDGGSSSLYLVPYNVYESWKIKDPYMNQCWHEKYCVHPFNGTFEIPKGVRIVKFEEI